MPFTINTKQPLSNSEFEIEGEIKAEILKNFREQAIKELGENVKIDGFRPGHIPEKVIIDKFGELYIIEEAGRLALEHHYPAIIQSANIKAIGAPQVTITKIAPEENFGFKIKTAVMPEVKLSDYKKVAKEIASKKSEISVTDKDVEDAIEDLRKQIAHQDHHAKNPDDKGHDHGDLPLPEINEEFMKNFGEFKSIDEFKEKVKEGISADRTRKAKEKLRLTIIDEVIKTSEISMPQMLVDSELDKMFAEISSNIEQMGMKMDDYLKHINKSVDDMKKEWLPDAEKRAKTQLILNKIAAEEKLEADPELVKKEVESIMSYYKDAEKARVEMYVEMMLLNERVWEFLEEQK